MKKKMKLGAILIDPKFTNIRPIDQFVVSRYRQAYRTGADFPPVVVDEAGRCISGNHRITAMVAEFGKDYEVVVDQQKFKTEAEALEFFAVENTKHGHQLTGHSRRMICHALSEAGVEKARVAQIFNVAEVRITEWIGAVRMVNVKMPGGRKAQTPVIVKSGPDIPDDAVLTQRQYQDHKKVDVGMDARRMAEQLTRWFRNGWIADQEETRGAMAELEHEIKKWFKG